MSPFEWTQPVTNVGVGLEPQADGTALVSISRVETSEGEVMLAPIAQLDLVRSTLEKNLADDEKSIGGLRTRLDKKLRDAGALMLQERAKWDASGIDPSVLSSALSLQVQADREASEAQTLQAKVQGIFANPLSRIKLHQLERDWSTTEGKLAPVLVAFARQAPATTVPAADAVLAEVREVQEELDQLAASIGQKKQTHDLIVAQLQGRRGTANQAGFDILLDAGALAKYGLQPVTSPLITKPGETAFCVTGATLTKKRTRTHYEGRSSGVSFPIFPHVRYRVGTFKGRPITEEYVAYVGTGDLVLTNQRVAYVAAEHGASIPIDKLLHVEAYTNGLTFLKEGREAAYAFLVDDPNRFLYYLNYVLEHRTPTTPTRGSKAVNQAPT